jgi:hypothetical protein
MYTKTKTKDNVLEINNKILNNKKTVNSLINSLQ